LTRFLLVLVLALAAAGTFVAVRWLLGDESGARQTARQHMLEREPERRRRDDPGPSAMPPANEAAALQ